MSLFNLGAPSWLWEAINGLWLMLCQWIYIGINWFYQVFEKIASVNLFSTEVFKEITSRIYVVMGIAMLFIFAYNLVLMIINPEDKKGSGAMGKVVKETMISLTVVVLLPTIFNYMYIVQSHILESNIIGQIIMGSVGSTTSDRSNCDAGDYDCLCDFSKFEEFERYNNTNISGFLWWSWSSNYTTQGNQDLITKACENYRSYNGSKITDSQRGAFSIAPTVFSAFYRPTNFSMEDCEKYLINNDTSKLSDDKNQKICINYYFDINMSKYTGNIAPFVQDSYLNGIISDSTDNSMEFDWLFALIAGGLAVWMFICYAMEIGVRVAKLGLLQIISPIAVMMRVIPGQKEKIFDKWFTHLKNTYLDVFIRLVIIYFSLFAISLVPDVINTLWISNASGDGNWFIKTLSLVVVILGILKFAQEAPALIKEFFGDSGRFALKSPKKQLQDNKVLQGGINKARGIAGGVASLATTKANQFGNFKENWNREEATFGSRARQLKDLASLSSFKKGYDSTKDAKTIDDWGYNVKKSAVDTLKDKGFIYRANQSFSEVADDLGNVIGKNYFSQDTKGLQSKADAMQLISDEAKLIIGKIEDDAKFKGVVSMFDSAIDKANQMQRPDLVSEITKEKVKALADMRNALLIEKLQGREATVDYKLDADGITRALVGNLKDVTKGINRELTSAVDNLNSALSDNFAKFSDDIKDSKTELGIEFGENMEKNLTDLQNSISSGNAKLIKNIKTVSEDMVASAKAEIINMEKKDNKK